MLSPEMMVLNLKSELTRAPENKMIPEELKKSNSEDAAVFRLGFRLYPCNPYTGYGRIVQEKKSKKIYGRIYTSVPVQKKKRIAVYVDRSLGVNLP